MTKVMIAISSGTGPRTPLDGISRRSASEMSQRAHELPSRPGAGGCLSAPVGSTSSAVLQPDQLRARRRGDQADVMGRDDHRRPKPVHRGQQVQDALGHGRVDVAGRLVGDDQLGPGDHRAGDRHPLLLAARQRRRPGAGAVGQADPGQHLADRPLDLCFAHGRQCAAEARHCRTPTGGGSGGNPGTPRRSGGDRRAAPRAAHRSSSSPNSDIRPRVGRWAR